MEFYLAVDPSKKAGQLELRDWSAAAASRGKYMILESLDQIPHLYGQPCLVATNVVHVVLVVKVLQRLPWKLVEHDEEATIFVYDCKDVPKTCPPRLVEWMREDEAMRGVVHSPPSTDNTMRWTGVEMLQTLPSERNAGCVRFVYEAFA